VPPQTASQPSPDEVASAYQLAQSRAAMGAALGAIGIWRQVDGKNLDRSFAALLPRLLAIVAQAQFLAAQAGVSFLARMLALQGAEPGGPALAPEAFAGLTGDGRPMGSLLYTPVALSKQYIGQGQRIADVITREEAHMALLVRTQVQDTGRMGLQAGIAAEPKYRGYVRKVNLPACARCIILSGRFYRYSEGFLRHPNCDCTMIPVAVGSDMVHAEDPAELIARVRAEDPAKLRKSLTEGDLRALDHGADLNQVINAHRGMTTAAGPGRHIKVTTEGTTKRGFAGQRLIREAGARRGSGRYSTARTPRLTPAQIFTEADLNGWDRTEIVRQLKRFGYVI
jgi:hypothetical protein